MSSLALELVYSVLLGFFLGFFYECIRICRIAVGIYQGGESFDYRALPLIKRYAPAKKEKKRKGRSHSFLYSIGDILFFVFSACAICVFIYYFNDGRARGFVFFGAFAGFFVYYHTLGRAVKYLSARIVKAMKICLAYALFFVVFPIYTSSVILCRVFFNLFCKIALNVRKLYDIIHMYMYYLVARRQISSLPLRLDW